MRILVAIILLLIPIMEMMLAGSGVSWLINLRLIYIVSLFLIVNNHFRTTMVFLILGSVFVELLTFQSIIGLTPLAMFLAILASILFFRFASFIDRENNFLRSFIILFAAIVFRHIFFLMTGLQSTQLQLSSLLLNTIVFILGYYLNLRLRREENAFTRK